MARQKKILPAQREYIAAHASDTVDELAAATGLTGKHVQDVLTELQSKTKKRHQPTNKPVVMTAAMSMAGDELRPGEPVALDNPDLVRFTPRESLDGRNRTS